MPLITRNIPKMSSACVETARARWLKCIYVHRLEKYSRTWTRPTLFFRMEDNWHLADGSSWAYVSECMVSFSPFFTFFCFLHQCLGGIDAIHRGSYLVLTVKRPYWIWTELVFRAWNELEEFGKLSYKTLQMAGEQQSFDGNPLYAILHEQIYCQGWVCLG